MKRVSNILTLLIVVLSITLLASEANAGGCRVIVRNAAVIRHNDVVIQKQFITRTLAATDYGYQGHGGYGAIYNEGAAEDRKLIRDLIAQTQQLIEDRAILGERARSAGLLAPAAPKQPQRKAPQPMEEAEPQAREQPPADDGVADAAVQLFASRCASCHESNTSAKKGGSFTMFAGDKLVQLSDKAVMKILTRCYSDDESVRMPRSGKALTDQEYAVLVAWAGNRK